MPFLMKSKIKNVKQKVQIFNDIDQIKSGL